MQEAQRPGAKLADDALSDRVHAAVSKLIKSQQLHGGDIIVESRLAELLGVSRTPLREALQKLEGEGLVVKNGRSFVVRAVGLAEYLQSLKVRELLEGEAASLGAGRVPAAAIKTVRENIDKLLAAPTYLPEAHWQSDDEVHALVSDYAGNPVLATMIRHLRMVTRLYETLNLADRLVPDATEHLEMIAGLESGDGEQARQKVQSHLRSLYRASI
ncbi:GntR family transcriptional regulator [Arsenicitalea aurantiaca]|uniref:GntR family transcriptional regulator n=1 Tax=Arsenicitalea aurantiaca TaxID=1783274 RepID=A0A433XE94_9HYPH|nr:GntR family transcriptional regulator [Arsenicitalea aurantiaca]RUT32457.1 GntR family transcriptional regulator [Arsenicitalea aurantiaca]